MLINEVEIEVKNSGLLEVPAGKEVDQLPQEHFQKLIDKKGYEAVIRGLTNLEVWNKNKNPKLSRWASNMADKLKVANKKDESYSKRFQQVLDEINAKSAAKLSTKAWKATKSGAKKFGAFAKDTIKKSGDTARNAIVAGAVAPIGAGIAQKYNQPKKKDQKYSASDVAAIAAALKPKSESLHDRLLSHLASLKESEEKRESGLKKGVKTIGKATAGGAAVGGATGATLGGGLARGAAKTLGARSKRGLGKVLRRGATALGAIGGGGYGLVNGAVKGAALGTIGVAAKALHDKHKANKAKKAAMKESYDRLKSLLEFARKKSDNVAKHQKLPEPPAEKIKKKIVKKSQAVTNEAPAIDAAKQAKRKAAAIKGQATKAKNAANKAQELKNAITKPLRDVAQGAAKEGSNVVNKTSKLSSDTKKVKDIFKGSSAMRDALKKKAFKAGLKGAAITAALGGAAYGVHKLRNRDNY